MTQYREDYKLYFKDKDGRYVQLTEQYREEVNDVIREMFRKKKLKYVMTYVESFQKMIYMKPYTVRMICYMVGAMRRNNMLQGVNMREIGEKSGVKDKYTGKAIKQLLDMDVIRRRKFKNAYEYMVNPAYFTRAKLQSTFTLVETYETLPLESDSIEVFNYEL